MMFTLDLLLSRCVCEIVILEVFIILLYSSAVLLSSTFLLGFRFALSDFFFNWSGGFSRLGCPLGQECSVKKNRRAGGFLAKRAHAYGRRKTPRGVFRLARRGAQARNKKKLGFSRVWTKTFVTLVITRYSRVRRFKTRFLY